MKFQEQIAGGSQPGDFPVLGATTTTSKIVGPGRMSQCVRVALRVFFRPGTTQGVVDVQASHDQNFTNPETIAQINWVAAGRSHSFLVPPEWFGAHIQLKPSTAVDGGGADAWAEGSRR